MKWNSNSELKRVTWRLDTRKLIRDNFPRSWRFLVRTLHFVIDLNAASMCFCVLNVHFYWDTDCWWWWIFHLFLFTINYIAFNSLIRMHYYWNTQRNVLFPHHTLMKRQIKNVFSRTSEQQQKKSTWNRSDGGWKFNSRIKLWNHNGNVQ